LLSHSHLRLRFLYGRLIISISSGFHLVHLSSKLLSHGHFRDGLLCRRIEVDGTIIIGKGCMGRHNINILFAKVWKVESVGSSSAKRNASNPAVEMINRWCLRDV